MPPSPVEQLLHERPFLTRLTRDLVADENNADDLEQDTWLRLLEAPPVNDRSLRGFIGTVARNLRTDRVRAAARRLDHERRSLDIAGAHDPLDEVASRSVIAQLRKALAALDERYRRVIEVRYLEGLAPPEVAAHLDLPLETVRTRLKRGLQHLRKRLDQAHDGDRGRWCGLLVVAATRKQPASAIGALVPLLLLLLAIVSGLWAQLPSAAPAPELAGVEPIEIEQGPVAAPGGAVADNARQPGVTAPDRASTLPFSMLVRARDVRGAAVNGLRLRLLPFDPVGGASARTAVTDDAGLATFANLAWGDWRLVPARGPERDFRIYDGGTQEVELLVPDGGAVHVEVIDRSGAPVPGAQLLVAHPGALDDLTLAARSDASGRAQLAQLDARAWVAVRAEGYAHAPLRSLNEPNTHAAWVDDEVRGPDLAGCDLRVVLDPERPLLGTVAGLDGAPLEAEVRVEREARTHIGLDGGLRAPFALPAAIQALGGEFHVRGLGSWSGWTLVVSAPGHRTKRVPLAQATGSVHIELAEGGDSVEAPALAPITGCVVGTDGAPLADHVAILEVVRDVAQDWGLLDRARDLDRLVYTDADGRFRFEECGPEEHVVWVAPNARAQPIAGQGDVRAGMDVVLEEGVGRREEAGVEGLIEGLPPEVLARSEVVLTDQRLRRHLRTRLDPRGTFGLYHLPWGPLLVQLWAPGRPLVTIGEITLVAGECAVLDPWTAPPVLEQRFAVRDSDGAAPARYDLRYLRFTTSGVEESEGRSGEAIHGVHFEPEARFQMAFADPGCWHTIVVRTQEPRAIGVRSFPTPAAPARTLELVLEASTERSFQVSGAASDRPRHLTLRALRPTAEGQYELVGYHEQKLARGRAVDVTASFELALGSYVFAAAVDGELQGTVESVVDDLGAELIPARLEIR